MHLVKYSSPKIISNNCKSIRSFFNLKGNEKKFL